VKANDACNCSRHCGKVSFTGTEITMLEGKNEIIFEKEKCYLLVSYLDPKWMMSRVWGNSRESVCFVR
jgi:hypothetical protein